MAQSDPFPRFSSKSPSAWDMLGEPTLKLLGLKKPTTKKLTPDQESKLESDQKAKYERNEWIADAERNTGSLPSQYLKKGLSNTASFLQGATGLADFEPGTRTQEGISNFAGQLATSIPTGALGAAKTGTAAVLAAGMPFASYKKILPYGRIFHGSPYMDQIKSFGGKVKNDAQDVLGWLTHGAESPKYAGSYALGESKHGYVGGKTGAGTIPLELGAKNVLDLVDPTTDDMAAAIQSFAPGDYNRGKLIEKFKDARRFKEKYPDTAVEMMGIDPSHHANSPFDKEGKRLFSNETETFKNLPAISVAESLRLGPDDLDRTQFDAIRYNDTHNKSWAWPDSTPVKSPLGYDYTPVPPKPKKQDTRFLVGPEGIEDRHASRYPAYGFKSGSSESALPYHKQSSPGPHPIEPTMGATHIKDYIGDMVDPENNTLDAFENILGAHFDDKLINETDINNLTKAWKKKYLKMTPESGNKYFGGVDGEDGGIGWSAPGWTDTDVDNGYLSSQFNQMKSMPEETMLDHIAGAQAGGVINKGEADELVEKWNVYQNSAPSKPVKSSPPNTKGMTPKETMEVNDIYAEFGMNMQNASDVDALYATGNISKADMLYFKDKLTPEFAAAKDKIQKNQFELSKTHAIDPDSPITDFSYAEGPEGLLNNASGDSAASIEALERMKAMKAAGNKFVVKKHGKTTELIGPEAVDYVPQPGESYGILYKGGDYQMLQFGGPKVKGKK